MFLKIKNTYDAVIDKRSLKNRFFSMAKNNEYTDEDSKQFLLRLSIMEETLGFLSLLFISYYYILVPSYALKKVTLKISIRTI